MDFNEVFGEIIRAKAHGDEVMIGSGLDLGEFEEGSNGVVMILPEGMIRALRRLQDGLLELGGGARDISVAFDNLPQGCEFIPVRMNGDWADCKFGIAHGTKRIHTLEKILKEGSEEPGLAKCVVGQYEIVFRLSDRHSNGCVEACLDANALDAALAEAKKEGMTARELAEAFPEHAKGFLKQGKKAKPGM